MTTELREILARNLRQLMRDRYDLDTQVKIRERSKQYTADGKGLAQATIQRVLACKVHAGIDTLDVLSNGLRRGAGRSLITDQRNNQGKRRPSTHSAAPSPFRPRPRLVCMTTCLMMQTCVLGCTTTYQGFC